MKPIDTRSFFRRVWRIQLDLAAFKAESIKKQGLTAHDVHAIATLADFGPMPASELGQRLGVTSGAVTGIVNRLIKAEVGVRETDPGDQRRHIITLQRSAMDDIFSELTEPARRRLESYSEAEIQTVLKFFADLDQLLHSDPTPGEGL